MTEGNIFIFRSCARLHLRQFELYYRNTVNKTALYSFLSTGLLLSYKNQPQVVGSITQLNKTTIFPRGEMKKKKNKKYVQVGKSSVFSIQPPAMLPPMIICHMDGVTVS